MVKLPPEYVETKYSGYFFNVDDQRLYSCKISGVLKPLKHQKPNFFNKMFRYSPEGGYNVSVDGKQRVYPLSELKKLKSTDIYFPVHKL